MTAKKKQKPQMKRCVNPECGEKKLTEFYQASKSSPSSDGKAPLCKECFRKMSMNEDGTLNIDGLKKGLQIIDRPFIQEYLDKAIQNNIEKPSSRTKNIAGNYVRMVNSLPQNSEVSYTESVIKEISNKKDKEINELTATMKAINDKSTIKWDEKDLQNRDYVISTFGYDVFADSTMTEKDLKRAYNILAGYCDTDGIRDDGHKMQAVIQITNNTVQGDKLNDLINEELMKPNPSESKIKSLTSAKKSLMDSIAKMAMDNEVAAKYNKNSKQGQESMTSKMKEMEEKKYWEIKFNMFDVKTSTAFKQIADLSNESIAAQVNFGEKEANEIIIEQRELIQKTMSERDVYQEDLRIAKNRILYLERLLDEAGVEYANN